MVIRIRPFRRPSLGSSPLRRQIALAAGSLLTPASLMAYVLAGWRVGADLDWTGEFAIERGIFSRWQVWLALAVTLHAAAIQLLRFARETSEVRSRSAT